MGCMWGTVGRGDEAASDQSHAQAGGDGDSAGHGASSAGAGAVCRCDEGGGSACTAGEAAAAEGAAAEGGVPLERGGAGCVSGPCPPSGGRGWTRVSERREDW